MKIRRLLLKNWMNYPRLETNKLHNRMFIIGPNASGKSNFLDALRFLRDVALPAGLKPSGGGLQKAVLNRGGLSKLRCLNARQDNEVLIEVELEEDDSAATWTYILGFKGEGQANNRIVITKEIIRHGKKEILNRPLNVDKTDSDRLTQTHLELTTANIKFRKLAHFFSDTTYLHLVPQLLKFSNLIGGNTIENDPFGQGFLQRIAATQKMVRDSRLRKIQKALDAVVPQLKELLKSGCRVQLLFSNIAIGSR
ncbi:MAG: AAA family ATPase [Verrucomicrobia bacterium]|nr:AAA family ATPase [Verrucomicrobiota bacterium]